MSKKLIKSGIIVSSMTLISRVLGLIRDVVIAQLMGAGAAADVFFFANKIPNFLRRLFAEGAFAQAFVPVLCEVQTEDESGRRTRELIAQVSGTLGAIVSIVTLFGMLASSLFVALFGFGWFVDWLNDGEYAPKFELASLLLKITFPYLWFISLTALAGSILNSIGKFAASAFTPVILNVCIISMAIFAKDWFSNPAFALAWGVFLGGLCQFLFQLPFLARAGLLVLPKWGWQAPGVKQIRKLLLPALFGVSVTQVNLLLDTLIASFLMTSSISWLYYADRLLEFPLGLFGIGIATVILPSLSKQHASSDGQSFQATLDWGLRIVSFMGIPAMAGLMVLAKPIVMVLFMRGAFSAEDVNAVAIALIAYLCGLMSFMCIKILAPGYYARQDTKTPVKIGIIALVSNMVFNLMLAPFLGYVGLALATAISATINAVLLYRGLHKLNIYQVSKTTKVFIFKIMLSALIMALVVQNISVPVNEWLAMNLWQRIMQLMVDIVVGIVCFVVTIFMLGVRVKHFKAQVTTV